MNSSLNRLEDYENVDELINSQNSRKNYISQIILLVQDQKFLQNEIKTALSLVGRISNNITAAREEYDKMKELLPKIGELNEEAKHMEIRMNHIENNLPNKFNKLTALESDYDKENVAEAPHPNLLTPLPTRRHLDFADGVTPVGHKPSRKDVQYLTQSEFSKIPSYMRGRISYDTINSFIDKFNKCIEDKYTLLNMGKSALKKRTEQEKLTIFKRQECPKTKGKYFITQEDLKAAMGGKIDKHTLNLIPMLRHTSRIQEVRDGGFIRYIANTEL